MTEENRKKTLRWLLRLIGLLEALAFIAVVMPRSWMELSHVWLGLGQMPEGSVLMFLIRTASYSYGMHGVFLWIIASDLQRFRPIVLLNSISFVLAGPLFFIIDYTSGMPWWWSALDGPFLALMGGTMLWLGRDI